MPTNPKDLKIIKVDFVEEGANPAANILLFKSKDGAPTSIPPPSTQGEGKKTDGIFKRFFARIAKAVGITEDIDEVMEVIEKEAVNFDEKIVQAQRHGLRIRSKDRRLHLPESLYAGQLRLHRGK